MNKRLSYCCVSPWTQMWGWVEKLKMKEHITWFEKEHGEPESFPWGIWFYEGWQVLLVIRLWNIPLSFLKISKQWQKLCHITQCFKIKRYTGKCHVVSVHWIQMHICVYCCCIWWPENNCCVSFTNNKHFFKFIFYRDVTAGVRKMWVDPGNKY